MVYTRLELLNSPWSPLSDSPLHDAPYIFYRIQIWTAGRPLKHTHSIHALCIRSHAVVWHCPAEIEKTGSSWEKLSS